MIAALLPVCVLWTFVACVSLCEANAVEAGHDRGAVLSLGMDSAPESECCPIVESHKAALAERLSVQATSTVVASPVIVMPQSACAVILSHVSDRFLSTDPPFERLLTLRI
jgi:hypothetical protein